ncbi:MAG: protease inhibitor I42 family protein [Clostridia bacterium]|nr:protease inhibitor I42 family protein [Clostridia bacterium]
MKRFLTLCVAVCLLLSLLCGAQAETLEGEWFELSAEDTVLTVRLPGDETNGYAWNAEFSDADVLELLTMEYENGQWAASYKATGKKAGLTELCLSYEKEGAFPAATAVLDLSVNDAQKIEIESAKYVETYADTWMEMSEDARVLTVRLDANATTGYSWTYEIDNPAVLELVTAEYVPYENEEGLLGVGGEWVASFRGLTAGTASLTLYYGSADDAAPVDTRTLEIAVAEDTALTLNFVEMEEILG